jgi:4-diphosphocytidyl-2-C-methyl-D-erythritol kinase
MLSLYSPAKVNLFLRILYKRSDGYHELASLFQAIDLCDVLHFQLSDEDKLTCTDPSLPLDHSNLVNKAIDLFRRKTHIKNKISVHLEKNIPQQAGLGGGSSNAATTLWALNQLFDCAATEEELAQWGAEIGSDISFFLSHGTAYCKGRGEILHFLDPLPSMTFVIVKPAQGLATPQVYKTLNPETLLQRDPEEILNGFLNNKPTYFNDLEIPAFKLIPDLLKLKHQLMESGFSDVLMSGSGTSFFCLGNGKVPTMEGMTSYSAKSINRSTGEWFTR